MIKRRRTSTTARVSASGHPSRETGSSPGPEHSAPVRVVDISTLGAPAGLPLVVRIAEEVSWEGYHCHPGSWAFHQVTVQMTIRGVGRCHPQGPTGPHRDIPQGHALIYDNRLHVPLVYGRVSPQIPWDFIYINLQGEIARLAIRDLSQMHHHVVPLVPRPALLAELQGALHAGRAHQVWSLAQASGVALRLLGALAAVGDADPAPPVDQLIAHAMALMASERSLAGVAVACGVSREHLARVFRARTGETLAQWRRRARMGEAARRILAGEPIAQVAHGCGYADSGHFATVFQDCTGLLPRDFRRGGGLPGWG